MDGAIAATTAQRAQSPWIRSAAWDGWWIFSGLWAPALIFVVYCMLVGVPRGLPSAGPAFHEQHFVLLFLSLAVLHRLSSIYAVVVSPIMRAEVRANPKRYVYVPLLILLATFVAAQAFAFHPVFSLLTDSPRVQLWGFFALALVVIVWDRWHFCMQEFGVLSIYRARVEQFGASDRTFDRLYVVALMLGVNSVLFLNAGFGDDRNVLWHGTPLSTLDSGTLGQAATLAFAAGMSLLCVALARELRHPKRSLPKLAFYVLIAGHSLILYALPHALSLFFFSYIVHHWMVAIALFNRITFNDYAASSPGSSTLRQAGRYLLRVGPFFIACMLFSLAFAPLDMTARLSPVPDTRIFDGAGVGARLIAGTAVGLFFAFGFLHYYYDRCLYSFSIPGVRKAVVPLLLSGPRAQVARPAPANDAVTGPMPGRSLRQRP